MGLDGFRTGPYVERPRPYPPRRQPFDATADWLAGVAGGGEGTACSVDIVEDDRISHARADHELVIGKGGVATGEIVVEIDEHRGDALIAHLREDI